MSLNNLLCKKQFSDVMVHRFKKVIESNSPVDQTDLANENFYLNGGKRVHSQNQDFPEYSQRRYLRMRMTEEAFALYNYLDPTINKRLRHFLHNAKDFDPNKLIKSIERSYGIQKIYDLHQKKRYKIETLFIAANVFDRYLALVGHWTVNFQQLVHLATISTLIAAKLEQPMSPCFEKMLIHLSPIERQKTSNADLIKLELEIGHRFNWNFNFQGPVEFIDRYMRILSLDAIKCIRNMSQQFCKFALNDAKFLNYRPSVLAASSVIIALNVHKAEQFGTGTAAIKEKFAYFK